VVSPEHNRQNPPLGDSGDLSFQSGHREREITGGHLYVTEVTHPEIEEWIDTEGEGGARAVVG
jgi:hypothetical protein